MKYYFGTLTVGKLGSLSQLTVQYVNESAAASAKLDATFLTLQKVTSVFSVSMLRKYRSVLTYPLKEAESKQMSRYSALRKHVENLQRSPDAAICEDAKQIFALFKPLNSKLYSQNRKAKNSYFFSLLDYIKDAKNATAVHNLGLESWIAEFENAVNEFARILIERETDRANINKSISASGLKNEMMSALDDFYAFVKGRANATALPEWVEVHQQLEKFYVDANRSRKTTMSDQTNTVKNTAV
ncbi:MAG: DUF6261 family protein [Bacteroidales bacterium]